MKLHRTSISISEAALEKGKSIAKAQRKDFSTVVEEKLREFLGMPSLEEEALAAPTPQKKGARKP